MPIVREKMLSSPVVLCSSTVLCNLSSAVFVGGTPVMLWEYMKDGATALVRKMNLYSVGRLSSVVQGRWARYTRRWLDHFSLRRWQCTDVYVMIARLLGGLILVPHTLV